MGFAFKVLAGLVGEHGSVEKGLALLRQAGQYGVVTSVEARTALMLFLRREAKYPEAAEVARGLKDEFPHDFLFWLEEANLLKDEGNAPAAIARYRATLEQAKTPGYFPSAHLELAWYGLADTLRGQHQSAASAEAFSQAAQQAGTNMDLKRRAELAAGQQYDILQQRDRATAEYQAVLRDGSDSPQASAAEKFLRKPFSAPSPE
jgi:tetratricopeptide (TPR) repeat protein